VSNVSVDLARAAADLDLQRRLRDVPDSACCRGVFFNMVRDELERRSLLALPEMQRLLRDRRKSYQFYSARELVEIFAIAGAIVGPSPREGMRQLFLGGSMYFAGTWFGQAMARVLKPDPAAALAWIEKSREHFSNYGTWRLERRGPERAILHMFGEYLWLDTAHRGGCEGLLVACGVVGEVKAELDTEFDGRLDIRWQLRS
jgi:uncharacterized protein (TIGR02265 family)